MNLVTLVVGIILCLFSIALPIGCIIRTPDNLRGFYGIMFGVCSVLGFVGGAVLIAFSF